MAADLVLRRAEESDGEQVAALHIASRAAAPMPSAVHTDAAVHYWLAGRLLEDEVWLAEIADVVVGYARLSGSWLDDLYVAPSRFRRGIGSTLLDVVKARRPQGFSLWVFETNEPARSFYAHHGLVELERTDGEANEERAPDLRLAWPGSGPLDFFRRQIDEVDAQLGDLLARRAALTRAVQPLKADARRDAGREREIVAALARRAPALGEARVARIMDAIITESLDAAR